jgi:NAD-dependent deacetylase
VVLTGAGISVESGLPSFPGAEGLGQGWRLEDVATPEGFARDPVLVQRFYDARRRQLLDPAIQPNAAQLALAEVERRWPDPVLLVTQSIDDLHERAGTRSLIPPCTAGCSRRAACAAGRRGRGARISASTNATPPATPATRCARMSSGSASCRSTSTRSTKRSPAARLFVAIGTSSQIYPAAGSPWRCAPQAGPTRSSLNLEPSACSSRFEEHRHGPATELVPRFVAELLARAAP